MKLNAARFIPALRWGREYRASWFATDLAAGATLGAVMVPVGLAFGELAGMPMAGLYAAIVPLVVYALLGSSRQLVIGADAAISTVVAVTLAPLATGDPVRLAILIALLALAMGLVCILAGLLRLGFMADFLAKPVIVGFMHGLAIVIFVGQLPKILGIRGAGQTTLAQFSHVIRNLGQLNVITFTIGVMCVAVILVLRKLTPRVPGMVIVLLGSLAAVHLFRLDQSGVAVVGEIPRGLPSLTFPSVSLEDVRAVVPIAFGAALLAFSDTVVTARAFASRNNQQIDANQELIALGLGNIASSVTQGLPISGSGSCTAIAESSRSRSQLTSITAAATVACVMLFLTPYLRMLPSAALGGILIAAAYSLCDFGEFRRQWHFRGVGLAGALVVMAGVVGIGVMEGILLGVLFSLVLVLRAVAFPHDALLGEADDEFHDMDHRSDARPVPGAVIYRFSGPLFFANCGQFRSRIEALSENGADMPAIFVLDASVIFEVDLAACETLIEVNNSLSKKGIHLAIVQLRKRVKVTLARGGVIAHIGEDAFFPTIAAALATIRNKPLKSSHSAGR